MTIQPQVPDIFAGMSMPDFLQLTSQIPLGYRLFHPESRRECIFVHDFLEVVERTDNPLGGRIPEYIHTGKLTGRPLRVCMAFIRWFGSNCGQTALKALMNEMSKTDWPRNEDVFQRNWDGRQRALRYTHNFGTPGAHAEWMSLDSLLNEAPHGSPLPSDFASPADAMVARALMEWLDAIPGTEFLCLAQGRIDSEYKAREAARHEVVVTARVQREADRVLALAHGQIARMYAEAGLAVPAQLAS